MWMNPDLKVYRTEIYIENNGSSLRTGMTCQAEVVIEQYQDALYVPIQTVLRVGGVPTLFVKKGNTYEPRAVQTGLDNNKMIHILDGLVEGETVLLAPPLKAAARDSTRDDSVSKISDATESSDSMDKKIGEKLKEASQEPVQKEETDGGDTRRRRGRRDQNDSDDTRP